MKRLVAVITCLCIAIGFGSLAMAATREVSVDVQGVSGDPIPVSFTLDELRRAFGITFRADWSTLQAFDASGRGLPVQIDDIDGDGTYSRDDVVSVMAPGPIKLAASTTGDAVQFPDLFTITQLDNGNHVIEGPEGKFAVQVTPLGTIDIIKFNGIESLYAKDIGALRYAGFPMSTYWVNNELKQHEEKTTFEEPQRVYDLTIMESSPVRVTVAITRVSDLFPGLTQRQVIGIYPTGDITVDTTVESLGYADMTKLLTIASGFMAEARDARHILPVFRAMEWADELGVTPSEYWADRNALQSVGGSDYVVFSGSGPAPYWWGASYIFVTPERWRTNYSESLGVGAAELLLDVPEIAEDPIDRLSQAQWQLEGEWRNGYFRWIPEEVVTKRAERGVTLDLITDMETGDWPLHLIPGDTLTFKNVYSVYQADSLQGAIHTLEQRYADLASVELKP